MDRADVLPREQWPLMEMTQDLVITSSRASFVRPGGGVAARGQGFHSACPLPTMHRQEMAGGSSLRVPLEDTVCLATHAPQLVQAASSHGAQTKNTV